MLSERSPTRLFSHEDNFWQNHFLFTNLLAFSRKTSPSTDFLSHELFQLISIFSVCLIYRATEPRTINQPSLQNFNPFSLLFSYASVRLANFPLPFLHFSPSLHFLICLSCVFREKRNFPLIFFFPLFFHQKLIRLTLFYGCFKLIALALICTIPNKLRLDHIF